MLILCSAAAGLLLDLLLGDPAWLPHPVVWMGGYIARFEERVRPRFPATPQGELLCGGLLALSLPALTYLITAGCCALAARVHPRLAFFPQTLWCWQSLALRGLGEAGRDVYRPLTEHDLSGAREAVGRIVGRDTERLDQAGVIRAAVESVAENFSDGVAAPMLYFFLGGAPLAMVYKAINTMDSCVGYRTARYLYFGRAAARLDDLANLLPSRLSALFFLLSAALTGQNASGAFQIWRRDRRKHPSPNSAQTESVCAGALGIRLGGPSRYFGALHKKPHLGDDLRPPEPEDILRAVRMMDTAALALFAACVLLRLLFPGGAL